jgi:WD40 repeat protein
MAIRMHPRVQFNDRDLWGVYHGFLRSHSRWLHKDDEDGHTEETLGLLEYALGYPLARVRKWMSQAALRHLKRMQVRDAGAASSTVSIDGLRFAYLACIVGESGLARDIALRIEDPPDAKYIGTRSEVCTPKQQHLAYAVRALFAEDRTQTEAQLGQVRRGRTDDEETLQATMIRAILDPDGNAFLAALGELLRLSARRAKKNCDLSDQILCVPGLGLAQFGIEQRVITAAELPTDDVRFPVELLSSECTTSTKVSPQEVSRFVAHREGVTCLALGQGSLVTAGRDHLVRLWDATTFREIRTLAGHTDLVSGIAPAWEQAKLVSVSWDLTVRAWNLHTGDEVACKNAEEHLVFTLESVARVPSSDLFVIGYGEGHLAIWDLSRTEELAQIQRQPSAVLALDIAPGGGEVLAATERNVLLYWDLKSRTLLRHLEGSEGPLYAALFHPVGPFAFSAGADGVVRMWDLQSARCVRRFEGHFGPVRCVVCTADGKWLVSCGDDETIRVWDAVGGKESTCLEGHAGTVRCVCIQDGSRLISGGDDGTVRIWDVSRLLSGER